MTEKKELVELIHIATDSVREILNHKDLDDGGDARKIYNSLCAMLVTYYAMEEVG
jgi:hypothetical protein